MILDPIFNILISGQPKSKCFHLYFKYIKYIFEIYIRYTYFKYIRYISGIFYKYMEKVTSELSNACWIGNKQEI